MFYFLLGVVITALFMIVALTLLVWRDMGVTNRAKKANDVLLNEYKRADIISDEFNNLN